MLSYIVRRLLLMIPTLFGVTAVVFFVMALAPGGIAGPLLSMEGNMQSGEQQQRIREYYNQRYGLDKPPVVQYARWLNRISPLGFHTRDDGSLGRFGFKWPDLGESLNRRRPVLDLIAESLPITLLLNALSIPLVYAVGVGTGLIAARFRGNWFDVGSGAFFLALWSIPTIWAGVLFIGLLANQSYLELFPTGGLHSLMADQMTFLPTWETTGEDGQTRFQPGWLLDTLWHLVLPVVCLSYGGFAFLTKLVRGSILDNLNADFVRTARAKGVNEKDILFRHVFRNSLLALITVAASILPALFGGAIVVETIFSLPGMGRLAVEAVKFRDRELVMAVTLLGGLIGLLSELIRDVCYAIADPRVSYD